MFDSEEKEILQFLLMRELESWRKVREVVEKIVIDEKLGWFSEALLPRMIHYSKNRKETAIEWLKILDRMESIYSKSL